MRAEVTIHETKTRLVQRGHDGEEIVIRHRRVPLAKLVPYKAEPIKRKAGRLRGQIELADDFDGAISDELRDLFGLTR